MEIPSTLVFRRRTGDLVCQVHWAAFSAHPVESGFELFFYIRGEHRETGALTSAEISIGVDSFYLDTLVGGRFEVPMGYDEELEEHVALIYYYDHEDFNSNVLEVLSRNGNSFHVRWTGTTADIDAYDGSEPDNQVVIDAEFSFQETREATYNHPVRLSKPPTVSKETSADTELPDPDQLSLWT